MRIFIFTGVVGADTAAVGVFMLFDVAGINPCAVGKLIPDIQGRIDLGTRYLQYGIRCSDGFFLGGF